jgi:hypothetical protein
VLDLGLTSRFETPVEAVLDDPRDLER